MAKISMEMAEFRAMEDKIRKLEGEVADFKQKQKLVCVKTDKVKIQFDMSQIDAKSFGEILYNTIVKNPTDKNNYDLYMLATTYLNGTEFLEALFKANCFKIEPDEANSTVEYINLEDVKELVRDDLKGYYVEKNEQLSRTIFDLKESHMSDMSDFEDRFKEAQKEYNKTIKELNDSHNSEMQILVSRHKLDLKEREARIIVIEEECEDKLNELRTSHFTEVKNLQSYAKKLEDESSMNKNVKKLHSYRELTQKVRELKELVLVKDQTIGKLKKEKVELELKLIKPKKKWRIFSKD